MDETTHFACKGTCKGASPEAGVCTAEGCTMKGVPLQPCGCTDGSHGAGGSMPEEKPLEL